MDRMTDERLADLERNFEKVSATPPICHELLQALKAERERIRELEQSAAKKDNAIIGYQKRIEELEDEIKRYKRIVPGTPATESRWLALVTRAETAEQRIRELEAKLERVHKLPGRWGAYADSVDEKTDALTCVARAASDCADELLEALADD